MRPGQDPKANMPVIVIVMALAVIFAIAVGGAILITKWVAE